MDAMRKLTLAEETGGAPFKAVSKVLSRETGWYDRQDYFSIAVVTEGEGRLATQPSQSRVYSAPFRRGELVFLRPADATFWRPADSDGFAFSFVMFPMSAWRSFAQLTGVGMRWERAFEPPRATLLREDSGVLGAFDRAIQRFRDEPSIFDLVEFWTVVVPALNRATGTSAPAPTSAPPWLVSALDAMREEANLRAGVARLTELAYVSPGYLAAMTRRHYGRTPSALVADLRLEHAGHLLRTTAHAVSEVATRCGFRSMTYFSNRFHREFGVSPRSYRSRVSALPGRST